MTGETPTSQHMTAGFADPRMKTNMKMKDPANIRDLLPSHHHGHYVGEYRLSQQHSHRKAHVK